jgi:phosphopantothenoylcysteine decarboxylase/phosphopantothenate--cysteine ligase
MSASTIFLFVTGSDRANDAPEIVRETVAAGWKTYTILTPNVSSVLSPDEIYDVLGSYAIRNYMDPPLDIFPFGTMLVAPCTFNTLNKLALGLADNLVTSMIADALGTRCPVFIAPSMNYGLWNHPQTRISEAKLKEWGCTIIPPCIDEKIVTMASVTDILQVLHQHFK